MKNKNYIRCPWAKLSNPLYVDYHDNEWGQPVHDDIKHFEMLTLEGAQAGLSWETILNKRLEYQKAFAHFDPKKVAKFNLKKIEALLNNPGIVRNRLKIESTINNAKAFINIQLEFGSFDNYIWKFVENKTIDNAFESMKNYPTRTSLSDTISKDLKKRGFKFVGTTIIYAYMQAVGLVNDHVANCFVRTKSTKKDWFIYMIRCQHGELYTGISTDVERRLKEHLQQKKKGAKYLRGKAPLMLVFKQSIGSKSTAQRIEFALKKLTKLQKESIVKKGKISLLDLR